MALILGGTLLLLALGLFWLSARLQRRTGLPRARVRYDDASEGRPLERPLTSRRYALTGRPDYLIERAGALIPVEVKPTRRAREPYEGDVLQLACYCLLVEEAFGKRPPYGLLRYADASWEIPFDGALRARLLDTLGEMHAARGSREVARSHNQPGRCAGCSQRANCSQSLA